MVQVEGPARAGATVLTLRAAKADIDAFASGTLTEAEFAKRVKATTRRDPGGAPTGRVGTRPRVEKF